MEGYSVNVRECSRQLNAKDRVKLKDITNAVKLDTIVTPDEKLIITPEMTAILDIHNEKSDNKDYTVFVLVDKNGEKYVTSSQSFINSYNDILSEMENEEDWSIEVYKIESKNYKGRYFITCSIV